MSSHQRSRGDKCLKCGETRGAIMDGPLNCWDGYDELGKHRFVPWPEDRNCDYCGHYGIDHKTDPVRGVWCEGHWTCQCDEGFRPPTAISINFIN